MDRHDCGSKGRKFSKRSSSRTNDHSADGQRVLKSASIQMLSARANSREVGPSLARTWNTKAISFRLGTSKSNEGALTICSSQENACNGHREIRLINRSEEHTSELQSPCNLVC